MRSGLFVALARASTRPVAEVKQQNLANTVWAFATAKQSDEQLFVALARAAMGPVAEFKHRISPTRHGHLQ